MKGRLAAAWVVLVVATACSDDRGSYLPLNSEESALLSTAGGGWSFHVTAETIGPNGEIWMTTGGFTLCESSQMEIDWKNNRHIITFERKCGSSTFSSFDGEEYDGGIVNVGVDTDSGYQSLGWVGSRMSDEGTTFTIPEDAGVHLSASLEPGCEVSSWRLDSGTHFGGTQLYIPYGTVGSGHVTFYCSG
jgi:hypothetical protein